MTTIPFRVGCDLNYNVSGPSAFIFNVSVVNNAFQRIVEEQLTTEPQLEVEESRSPIEEKRHHRFSSSAGPLRVLYSATVELSHHVQSPDNVPQTPPGALPADVVPYLYPSRYCESDKLVRLAQHEFGKLQPGFSRVTAICNWIHNIVEYLRGATNPLTSAYDTATERAGVCRDFAHLGIAFCRAVSFPPASSLDMPLISCRRISTPTSKRISTAAGISSTPAGLRRRPASSALAPAAMRPTLLSRPSSVPWRSPE